MVLPRAASLDACRGDLFFGVERSYTAGTRSRPSPVLFGFTPLLLRGTKTLRFGERSRTTVRSDLGDPTSSLLSPLGSRGCGKSARNAAVGEARRGVGSDRGFAPGNLVKRPFPFPRASIVASSSSLDDEGKEAGRFDEGRGLFFPPLRSSMGHDAAGAAAAFPPATLSAALMCFPVIVTESSVRLGLVDGEKERASPVTETASGIVTLLRLITCGFV